MKITLLKSCAQIAKMSARKEFFGVFIARKFFLSFMGSVI